MTGRVLAQYNACAMTGRTPGLNAMAGTSFIELNDRDGAELGVADGDRVQVKINGPKPGVMGGVLIRANDKCALDFHIDTDDGNAFLLKQGQLVTVLGKEE